MPYSKAANIPKHRSFSLGDFHDFERCAFLFFVKHHLDKKYELAEGNQNQTVGTLLDLAIKKYHNLSSLQQSKEVLPSLVMASASQMRDEDSYNREVKNKQFSFYTAQIPYLLNETINKSIEVFQNYYQAKAGKIEKAIHKNKLKPFWKYEYLKDQFLLWGGGDAIELGADGVPEVVDYKYYSAEGNSKQRLDLDQTSKLYVLLSAQELLDQGFKKARFKIRLWEEPEDQSLYEEFDLTQISSIADFFADKIRRILGASSLSFCEKDYCQVCKSEKRAQWILELQQKGFLPQAEQPPKEPAILVSDLPF